MHCMKQPPPPHKEHHVYIFTVNYTEDPEWTLCTTTISKINLNLTYILENMPLSETVLLHCWVTLFIISFFLWLCKQWREKKTIELSDSTQVAQIAVNEPKDIRFKFTCILIDVGFLYALYVCLHTDYICLARNDFKDRWNKKKNMAVALWSCDLPQSYTYKCTSCHAFVNSFKLNSE